MKNLFIFVILSIFLWNCSNSANETDDVVAIDNDTNGTNISEIDSTKTDESNFDENIDKDSVNMVPLAIDGMLLVKSSKTPVLLGTNNNEAPDIETPQMKVIIDYDYLLDKHETTCEEYISIMKKFGPKESFANTYKCQNKKVPIADVTYYDAILFANAKTKYFTDSISKDSLVQKMEMDSVYSYSQVQFDEEGHCTNLLGFIFYPEKNGFRLPTESEWVKAASLNWDVENSWNNGNANFYAHEVCTKHTNDSSFCDLAGNLMEWVNDWLGNFKDTTVTNYVGAPDGGELGERVVKGGSFYIEPSNMNTYSRGDVYSVTSSTKVDYVGFRLAYGSIKNPLWLNSEGKTAASVVTTLASSYDIYPYTKSYNIKLAFRNDVTGNLAFIDYTSGFLSVVEIEDTISVYHPEISPDGERVAFCTSIEGISGNSTLYVRNLDKEGSNLVKLDVKSAAIPRWRILSNGDTVITYVTNAGNNKTESEWKSYSTWQVPFKGGIFGIPEKIMEGSFHGGISEDNKLAVTGSKLLRARMSSKNKNVFESGKDSIWYNGEQACNVSMAQDGSKRTAFLDFAGKTGRSFVGKKYNTHQYLLVADNTGKLVQSVAAPGGYTFDHSEWAVGSANNNIVATLTNVNGAHKRITLINLEKGETTDLAEGDELWHPSLWIKSKKQITPISSSSNKNTISSNSTDKLSSSSTLIIPSSSNDKDEENTSSSTISIDEQSSSSIEIQTSSSDEEISSSSFIVSTSGEDIGFELDPDSAGIYYNNSGASSNAAMYRYKIELLWKYKDIANVAILGSSRSKHGVNPLLFSEPIFAINFGINSTSIYGHSQYFFNYILPHIKKLKVVILSIDPDRGRNTGKNNYNIFHNTYKSYPGYVYDKNHNYWIGKNTSKLYEMTYRSPGPKNMGMTIRDNRGFESSHPRGWGNPVISEDSCWMDYDEQKYLDNLNLLNKFIQTCNEKNITLIGVLFPTNPKYKETGAYGYAGLRRSEAPRVINDLIELTNIYPNFILFDENKMGNHDYTDEMGFDYSHLSTLGAEKMTHRLDSLIKTLNINFGE